LYNLNHEFDSKGLLEVMMKSEEMLLYLPDEPKSYELDRDLLLAVKLIFRSLTTSIRDSLKNLQKNTKKRKGKGLESLN
jgi:hypothetical protein